MMVKYKFGKKSFRTPTTMWRSALILAVLCSTSLSQNLRNLTEKYNRESRIINGADAKEGQFPYQAILRGKGNVLCGGSIIGDIWILTAAHCLLKSQEPNDWVVSVGTIFLEAGTDYAVAEIIPHEKFNINDYFIYDIALFRLKKKIKFNEKVNKIELESSEVGEVNCVVSGFGSTTNIFHKPSKKLKYLNTTVKKRLACSLLHESKICTQGPFFSSACAGDSGGPLVADGKQIGIVSYGDTFCSGLVPTVYTKIAYYLPWINETIHNTD